MRAISQSWFSVFPMYMGVILTIFMGRRGELRIPHVYGGDPLVPVIEEVREEVFPMYMGVIPWYLLLKKYGRKYSPCIWG